MVKGVERWRPVPILGFDHLYQISDHGRVWVNPRTVQRVHTGPYKAKGKLLSPRKGNQYGHLCVTLYRGPVKQKVYVHQLVAEAFIPKQDGKPWVLHGPQGVTCNHIDNLRWGDQSTNEKDKSVWPGKPGRSA